jgi:transcriptional regulator with XRE-family HTH domain
MDIQYVITLLQSKGLTQAQIASEVGCSQANIAARKKHTSRPSDKLVTGLYNLLVKYGLNDTIIDKKQQQNKPTKTN